MNLKIIAILILLTSINTFADQADSLAGYLRSKSIRCTMTQDELREQVIHQLDFNIRRLNENLKRRGSEIEKIAEQRDQLEIGIFPHSVDFDFYVLEQVAVVIQGLNFPVQTTYHANYSADAHVTKGLWFPLSISDSGAGKPCLLSRVAYREDMQKSIPVVDLVIGDPPRVVAPNILQVMDPFGTAQPPLAMPEEKLNETTPPPVPSAPPPRASKSKDEGESDTRSARESRRHHHRSSRHHYHRRRSHHHRHHRRHRSENYNEEAPEQGAPPTQPSECNGETSFWTSAGCNLGIVK
jgi:hypothetical protein